MKSIKSDPNTLLDTFSVTGNDYESFRQAVTEMENITAFEKIQSRDILPVSVFGQSNESILGIALDPEEGFFETLLRPFCDYAVDKDDSFRPRAKQRFSEEVALCNNFLKYFNDCMYKIPKDHFFKRRGVDFTDVMEEINKTKLVFGFYDDKHMLWADEEVVPVYLTSEFIASDLFLLNIKGDFAFEPTMVRNAAIAQQLNNRKEITIITRNIDGIKKVFAIRSGKYTPIPQTVLCDVIDDISKDGLMGEIKVHSWDMSHSWTSINIEFPEQDFSSMYGMKDKLVPGLYLETSDTGDCSITAYETWRVNNSVSFQQKVSHVHSGSVTRKDIIKNITEKIFSNYTKLPEALCSLMTIDVAPEVDTSTADGQKENKKHLSRLLKSVFKQLDAVKTIGKKNEKKLREAMELELDETAHYTAYDIAINIMSLPERANGFNKSTMESLQTMVGRAPYVDYTKYLKEEEEEEIVLC